jgi:hypothetical protein
MAMTVRLILGAVIGGALGLLLNIVSTRLTAGDFK